MKPEFYWNDESNVNGLCVGNKVLGVIHYENGSFYLVARAGNIRFCYDILNASTLEEAKEEAVDKIKKALEIECERVFAEYVDLATDYSAFN